MMFFASFAMLGMTLLNLVGLCAPNVHPRTSLGIISVESSGQPWALHDNTTRQSYFPERRGDAEQLLRKLLARGDSVDVGLMQVNDSNFGSYGVSWNTVLEPCTNVRVGASIITENYREAVRYFGPTKVERDAHVRALALFHALMAYNTGSLERGDGYAEKVWTAAIGLSLNPPVRSVSLAKE